jgi:thymidylate kinase
MARTRTKAGRLIVVEGPDGVGKTTVCRLLAERLRARGVPALLLSFPGRKTGTLGHLVYRLHHAAAALGVGGISPLANQTMHIAAHIDAVERVIRPELELGRTVILDRLWWSTWVYGVVAGCDRRSLALLLEAERVAWGRVRPAATFLLRRPAPFDRSEEGRDRWRRLADEYELLAAREQSKYPVVRLDNLTTPEDCADAILAHLDRRTNSRPVERSAAKFEQMPIFAAGEHPKETPAAIAARTVLTHILPARPTVAYDTYWRFAAERQEIFFKRVEGRLPPWTADPILAAYKFTNAYRASDRVSQYLIRHVIYRKDLPATAEEVFFRVILFKLFNKIGTWQALEAEFGAVTYDDFAFEQYDRVLSAIMQRGDSIYSAAYIMPSGGRALGYDRKHRNHFALLERMMADSLPQKIADAPTMQRAFALLRNYPTIGDFLAYQYVTDLNYSEITNFSEGDFVVPGPGALDGIRKCFADPGGMNEPELIKFMADRQERESERLGLTFRSLWGRPLQLIDCQNLFCEVDKYSRVHHPELAGISGRQRIKQRFGPTPQFPTPWYPPKWGINDRVAQTVPVDHFINGRPNGLRRERPKQETRCN